jgi:small neutral amino acid transporter SnatA (MarC family)
LSFADADLARLLVALAVLLIAAHGMGSLFARFGQPPAIGEIVGGILLGPTALAAIPPQSSTGSSRPPESRPPRRMPSASTRSAKVAAGPKVAR